MPAGYAHIFRFKGTTAFYLVSLPSRIGLAMISMAAIVLVARSTGSYGTAGGVVAAFAMAGAIGGPLTARLSDRIGQTRTLAYCVSVHGVMLGSPHLSTAFAVESLTDDFSYVIGPAAAVLLATHHPSAGCLLLPYAVGPWSLAVLIFLPGLGISPALISGNACVEKIVPRSRLTEALAWLGGAGGLGVAVGAAVSGQVVKVSSPTWAFVIVGASAAAAFLFYSLRRTLC